MITTSDVQALFDDLLGQIGDETLRKQVVDTWVDGCQQGGWESVEQLEQMPFTILTDTRGIGFIAHTRAVTAGAVGLARAQLQHCKDQLPYAINMDYVVAGGLVHDVGKLLEFELADGAYRKSRAGKCTRHPISGTVLGAKHGLPDDVLNIIACHSKEGDGRPKRVETILVHQADFATFDPLVMLNKGTLIEEA